MKYNFMNLGIKLQIPINSENIAKGITDPRLECSCQSNFFRSYSEVLHKFWSNFIFRISAKHQPQNLKQTSASKYWPNFASESRPRFNFIFNLYKTSAAKYKPNSSFKILSELQLQNIDQTFCSKSEQKISFMTKPQLPNLQQTVRPSGRLALCLRRSAQADKKWWFFVTHKQTDTSS